VVQPKAFILHIFECMNGCFKDIYGDLPLDKKEMLTQAKRNALLSTQERGPR
jgi:hypothetical protein